MKSLLLNVMYVCVFGMLAVSCSQSMDEVSDPVMKSESKKTQVMFTISLDDSSRAISSESWSDSYQEEDGLNSEKVIKNLQVMLFSNDGDFLAEMQNPVYYETSTKGVYEFIGDISIDGAYITTGTNGASILNAKMMVLANCSKVSLGAGATYEDVMAHSFAASTSPNEIPMWGLQTVNTTVNAGERSELPAIDMLRAMAKVEVIMAAEGYTMENVVLNRYNAEGYCMPNVSNFSNLQNTASLNTENNANYLSSSETTNLTIDANNNKVVFYIPECENSTENPLSMYVNIENENGEDVDVNLNNANIYFKDYSDDSQFNVVRNHVYRYTITTINDNLDMELTCNVKEWEKETESWEFTENITTESNIAWKNTSLDINKSTGVVIIPNTNDYICTFELSTPVDGTWQASLIPVGGQTDAFEFVGANSGTIGTGATLTIKAKYEKVFNENNAAKLRIVVRTKDGRTLVANLSGSDQFDEYTLVQNVNANN